MNVLALLTDGYGARGGIARYNQDLMSALSQSTRISNVTVLPRFGQSDVVLPSRVAQVSPAAGKIAWSARALLLAASERFDVIFCGHLNAVRLAAMIAKMRSARLWVQVHGIEAWEARDPATCRALAVAELVTSVSRYTRKRVLEWSDIDPDRVRVLPNTFAAGFAPRPRNSALAMQHGLGGRKVILTVGRLATAERYKGHDRILRAMPRVLAMVPDTVYLIVGSGDDQQRLQHIAHEAGVASRVIFAGQVADADLPEYFALAHVFAMPSTGEGFGIAFLETAASGLSVVGGNRDGSLDALGDGVIGRALDPYSSEDLVDALVEALLGRGQAAPENVQRFCRSSFSSHVDQLVQSIAH
jgi:phosphatidylinositol alpha-1,6-mannosyltransferase